MNNTRTSSFIHNSIYKFLVISLGNILLNWIIASRDFNIWKFFYNIPQNCLTESCIMFQSCIFGFPACLRRPNSARSIGPRLYLFFPFTIHITKASPVVGYLLRFPSHMIVLNFALSSLDFPLILNFIVWTPLISK